MRSSFQALRLLVLISLLAFLGCSSTQVRQASGEPTVGFSFDADDNLFTLPTQIFLFHKKTGREAGVTTADFALIRDSVGKSGKWRDYEFREDPQAGSYRDFIDLPGEPNTFLEHLKQAMAKGGNAWRAPAFDVFVIAMQREDTALDTTLITSRSHNPENVSEGLEHLKARGLISRAPPPENIWTVTHPQWAARYETVFGKKPSETASSSSARKALVMESILDEISKRPLSPEAPKVVDAADSKLKSHSHLWGYSDDDWANIEKARDVIQKGLDEGRWRNIKVTLIFTGLNHPGKKPHSIVLRPKAKPRSQTPEEDVEWRNLLKNRKT